MTTIDEKIEKYLMSEAKSLPSRIVKNYLKRARSERMSGGSIEINSRQPYIAITMSDGSEYFFQGKEADDLLSEVPDNIGVEDYILATAQNW